MIKSSHIGIFSALTAITVLFVISMQTTHVIDNTHDVRTDDDTVEPVSLIPNSTQHKDEATFILAMVKGLIEKHKHEIHMPAIQMSMQDFRDFVFEQYPHNGVSLFKTIMQRAFPDHAAQILALVTGLDLYDKWYADNLLTLNDLDPLTKNGTIWQKRHEIFGDLAEEIWHKEIQSQEYKRQTVQQTLDTLNNANDISMQESLYILQNTLNELYPDEQANYTLNKGVVSSVYFQLESVQKNLAEMSPQERKTVISQSRKQLGFSEQDIKDLAIEDARKEQRWQNGYEYMSARDQLSQSYSGDILNNKLTKLREKYFKNDASTIAAEEKSGFYRYNRPRFYGSN